MTMTLIETKTLTSSQSAIEFTSIPQNGTDLLITNSLRTSDNTLAGIFIRFNGITTDYLRINLIGDGSTAYSFGPATDGEAGVSSLNNWTSNTFGNGQIYIPNYTGSTNKTWSVEAVNENNATRADQYLVAGLWSNTAAITSLSLIPLNSANFVSGSTISLYKITKGSSGGVVVS